MKKLALFSALLLSGHFIQPLLAASTQASLIVEHQAIVPGQSFSIGLKLKMEPHWHTYWKNPGDSGLPTKIKWTLPEGFIAGEIQWPTPHYFEDAGIVSFAYKDEVLLISEVKAPANLPTDQDVSIEANVSWLECKEACLPGRAKLTLSLPVAKASTPSTEAALFKATRKSIPAPTTDWSFSHRIENSQLLLNISPPEGTATLESLRYFPYQTEGFELATPSSFEQTEKEYLLKLAVADDAPAMETLKGVLSFNGSAVEISSPAGSPSIEPQERFEPEQEQIAPEELLAENKSLFSYLLFAFLGGIILNAMPCVFPVISLKVLGFVQQANHDRSKVMKHAGMFTLGVLVSFWALAFLVIALQSAGASVGWGFQLQHPQVVLALILLFTLLAINLFGVFEIGVSLTSKGSNLSAKSGYSGSFFSGLLATVVATPCTAPFLAPAVGFAFAQPGPIIFAIFSAVGLGMALPYTLLSSSATLIEKMPKPGAWMETLKQAMGFIMLATAIWLAGVYRQQTGPNHLQALLYSLVLLGLGAWIYGRWGAIHRSTKSKGLATLLFVLSIAGSFILPGKAQDSQTGASSTQPSHALWQAWSPESQAEAIASGKPVFVDFTAAWCLSCQVNKKTTLHRASVEKAFADKDVILLEADWTDKNETIRQALAEHGRSGVPVYALYAPNETKATLLPEVLTPKIVIEAIENL